MLLHVGLKMIVQMEKTGDLQQNSRISGKHERIYWPIPHNLALSCFIIQSVLIMFPSQNRTGRLLEESNQLWIGYRRRENATLCHRNFTHTRSRYHRISIELHWTY